MPDPLPQQIKDASYCVSARRYRPKTFEHLFGQESLVQILSNALIRGKLPHAFIFTGIRGVGKTTVARILARALNCVGIDGKGLETVHPCGQCEQCLAIDADRHLDVIEMDAASRTGVDDVREIIEAARYKAVSGRYKIYIIDEVHMLSKSAFNALLKTLEEPPTHVKFIFATTEIRKVPQTVLSRCMRFDLKRLKNQDLIRLFTEVCSGESVTAEPQALALIAQAAEGSARDGLSILDQAITLSEGHLKTTQIQEMLGLSDRTQLLSLMTLIFEGQVSAALAFLETLYHKGADPLSILRELLDLVHGLTLLKVAPQLFEENALSEEEKTHGEALASKLSLPVLTRTWQLLGKGIEEAQFSPSPLQAARMILVRVAYVSDLPSPEEVLSSLLPPKASASFSSPPLSQAAEPKVSSSEVQPSPLPSAPLPLPQTFTEMVDLFHHHHEPLLHAYLRQDVSLLSYAPGQLVLHCSPQAPQDLVATLIKYLNRWTGISWDIKTSSEKGQESLHVQHQKKEDALKTRLSTTPLVEAALKTFSGATIQSISRTKGSLKDDD